MDSADLIEEFHRSYGERYRIEGTLGAGGGGTVFAAHDLAFDRAVAVKFLHPRFAGAVNAKRFAREVKTLGRLDHPNVLAVLDAGRVDDVPFYVTRRVLGSDLADHLARVGPLSVAEARAIVGDLLDALAYAHGLGLVHRDIKPENILLEANGGRAVVADFGIALALGDSDTQRLTSSGMVVGTPRYMSPEQATGREVGVRSDLYSVACVAWEMLSGEYPFPGRAPRAILARKLSGELGSLRLLRPRIPADLETVLKRALDPSPDERFESAEQFRDAFFAASEEGTSPRRWARARFWVGMVLGIVLVSVVGLLGRTFLRAGGVTASPAETFDLVPPPGVSLTEGLAAAIVSPDGGTILLVGTDSTGASSLWLRDQSNGATRRIPGTEGGEWPFWAPDGRRFGFFADRRIWTSSLTGGRRATPARTTFEPRGATWTPADDIIYAPDQQGALRIASLATGSDRELTRPDSARGEIGHLWPQATRDGRGFVYFVPSPEDSIRGIYGAKLRDPVGRRLVAASGHGVLTDDYLLYYDEGQVLAVRVDGNLEHTEGSARPVLQDVAADYTYHGAFSVSASGILVHTPDDSQRRSRLVAFDTTGARVGYASDVGRFRNFTVSPDGARIATQLQHGTGSDIQILGSATGTVMPLTANVGQAKFPVWSEDGSEVAYVVQVPGGWALRARRPDASGPARTILVSHREPIPTDWSDQRGILFYRQTSAGDFDMYTVAAREGAPVEPLVEEDGNQLGGTWSPSGRYLAYAGTSGSEYQIYVRGPSGSCQLAVHSGMQPRWGASDERLFFVSMEGTIYSASLVLPACIRGTVRPLITDFVDNPRLARNHFDLSFPGSFLVVDVPAPGVVPRLMVRLDWKSLLE